MKSAGSKVNLTKVQREAFAKIKPGETFDVSTYELGFSKPKWTIKKVLMVQLIAVIILAALGTGGFLVARQIPRTLPGDLPGIARAFYVAELAYLRQGNGKPIQPDYTGGNVVIGTGDPSDDQLTWGLYSNSEWLTQLFREIVPFYSYENMTPVGHTPNLVAFMPLDDSESFHILGQYAPWSDAIVLNERFMYDIRYNDDRELLGTLIHEGLHAQGGNFLSGDSVFLESHTVAGTLEIEAAMCNYGNEVACRTFWYDLHDLANSTVRSYARKYNAEGLFLFANKLLWRTPDQWSWVDKSGRHWADNQDELTDLLYKYDKLPFEDLVIPNICGLTAFDTGMNFMADDEVERRLMARFDDARYLLGIYQPLVCWGVQYHPAVTTIVIDLPPMSPR